MTALYVVAPDRRTAGTFAFHDRVDLIHDDTYRLEAVRFVTQAEEISTMPDLRAVDLIHFVPGWTETDVDAEHLVPWGADLPDLTTDQVARLLSVPNGRVADWKHHRRVVPIGQLNDRTPLYRFDQVVGPALDYHRKKKG